MRRNLVIVLLIAFIGRAVLLASDTVSFHSDEAVVALMARHILQGERPVFFYGQAYMGSLDAWLVAVGFSLFGESVLTIRLVQSALYLLIVASSYWVAWRLSRRVLIATIAALVIALPSVLLAVYTTATLGGYNETLLLGNLLLLLGYDVTHEHRHSWWRWAALGLAAGVGWWSNGLIVAFALPVGLLLLVDGVRQVSYRNPSPNSGRGDSGSSGIPSSPRRGAPVVPLPRIRGLSLIHI
ncbi:MAG: glycosyltransferase family 39 protein [Anaerolinea sp.]|nr:glycosyltransferase family 39 protein [Anaerolinea sp.]